MRQNRNIFVPVSKTTRPENLSSKLDPPKTKSLEPTKVIVCDRTAGGWIPCTGYIAERNEFGGRSEEVHHDTCRARPVHLLFAKLLHFVLFSGIKDLFRMMEGTEGKTRHKSKKKRKGHNEASVEKRSRRSGDKKKKKKKKKKTSKRDKLVVELLSSERAHVENLQSLLNDYVIPLRDKKILPPDDLHDIFCNVELLRSWNVQFLEQLEGLLEDGCGFGELFLEMVQNGDLAFVSLKYFNHFSFSSSDSSASPVVCTV